MITEALAPIVLFAYARPLHLKRCIEALTLAAHASDSELFIFSDGPRNATDEPGVAAVRTFLQDGSWQGSFARVELVESVQNHGLASSVISGVTEVIKQAGTVIVIEDDLVVSPDFITFMNSALQVHASTMKLGSVTGYCPLPQPPIGYQHDCYQVPRSCSHGWGTWRDRWERVDWNARDAIRLWREPALRRRFESTGTDKIDRLRRQLSGQIDSWSIRFNLWHALEDRAVLYPRRNLVENIGFDGSGTHTRSQPSMLTQRADVDRLLSVELPTEDSRVLAEFRRLYSGALPGRMRRLARNYFLPSAVARQATSTSD